MFMRIISHQVLSFFGSPAESDKFIVVCSTALGTESCAHCPGGGACSCARLFSTFPTGVGICGAPCWLLSSDSKRKGLPSNKVNNLSGRIPKSMIQNRIKLAGNAKNACAQSVQE